MLLGNPITAQVVVPPSLNETSVAPLTVYNCFEPVINCDMLQRSGEDVLKAITWDNGTRPPLPPGGTLSCANAAPGINQAYVYIEDWVGNQLTFALQSRSKQPDIVLADDMQNPGVDYYIGVVYVMGPNSFTTFWPNPYTQFNQTVWLDVYHLTNAGTATMAATLYSSTQVKAFNSSFGDIDLVAHQGHPHIDMWSDMANTINGLPSMHRFAMSWTQYDPSGILSNVYYIHDDITTLTPFSSISNLPFRATMADVACHTSTDNEAIINIATSDDTGKHLFYTSINTTLGIVSTPLLLDTFPSLFPRIEAMSQAQLGLATWQVVAQIRDTLTNVKWQVFGYNDLNIGNPTYLSDIAVLGYNTDFKAAAVAAGVGNISGDIGNTQYTTGFYDWYSQQNIYSRAIDLNSGLPFDPDFYQVNNKPLINVTWDLPHVYAVSNCSNSGYGLLSAYTSNKLDGFFGGVIYKYSGNMFQYKPTSVNPKTTKMQWVIYPNPSNNHVSITGLKTTAKYTVHNSQGTKLQSGTTAGSINIAKLPTGLYTIRLQEGTRNELYDLQNLNLISKNQIIL